MRHLILMFTLVCLIGCKEEGGNRLAPESNPAPKSNPAENGKAGPTGTDIGNGGDHVRSTFLNMGDAVLKFLKETDTGKATVEKHGLNLDKLKDTLTIKKITTLEGELKDNGGSDVDAIGIPDSITLKKEAWLDHFERERDVYSLVFHEMLRSASINDDNYTISQALKPFPREFMIKTRLTSVQPLIKDDLLSPLIDSKNIVFGGPGCLGTESANYVDFDYERNVLELTTKSYTVAAGTGLGLSDSRKACAISIPVAGRPGKRVVFSQLDLEGQVGLPLGASVKLRAETFIPGSTGPVAEKTVEATTEEVKGRTLMRINQMFTPPCGQSYNLRINTSAQIRSSEALAKTRIEKLRASLKLESCE